MVSILLKPGTRGSLISSPVFIIRFAERRIDQLLDQAILEYVTQPTEVESVKFESEWSIFKSLTARKKTAPPPISDRNIFDAGPTSPSLLPTSSSGSSGLGFRVAKQGMARGRTAAATTPLQTLFTDVPPPPSPDDVTSFLTALHTLMVLSGINPAFITQIWSQVMYWTACAFAGEWAHAPYSDQTIR